MFWKNLYQLCQEQNTTPTRVVKDLGISVGSITKWKNGSIPSKATLKKISNYFSVSVEYFFIEHKKEKTPVTDESDELNEYLEQLKTRPEMRMLFSLAKGATKEDVEKAVAIIEALRKTENG